MSNLEAGKGSNCAQALSTEDGTSPLFYPRAFTPVELRRMVMGQIRGKREVHILTQQDGGVLETTLDFKNARISRCDFEKSARETEELIEISDGFFFQIPTE